MNDIEFILREDAKQKKSSGRGYYAKKNGSKSKKCSLPSDNLSAKELKKMNGECKMYNLSKPMSYHDFCIMPTDLRIEYLTTLRDKYGANQRDIAEMMGTTHDRLSLHRRKHLNGQPYFSKGGRFGLKEEEWKMFIDGEPKNDDFEGVPAMEEVVDISASKINVEKSVIHNGSLSFKGKPADIFKQMMTILNSDEEFMISVTFSKNRNNE